MRTGRGTVISGAVSRHPWLTVIVPSFCGEQWLSETLESVAREAADGIEVILIDNSPTKGTLDCARAFSDRIDLRVFSRPDLVQWHVKTNFGVSMARAPHACWLHQDDLWMAGRAAAAREWIAGDPAAKLHLSPCAIIDRYGHPLGVWRCPLPTRSALSSAMVTERLIVQNFIAAPSPIFRTQAWIECGGLDEDLWYTADWDVWLKIAAAGPVCYHDQITAAFRIHGGSLTMTGSRDIVDFHNQMKTVFERHLKRAGDIATPVRRAALASIAVNTALASAVAGDYRKLPGAFGSVLGLGPVGIYRYLRDSRIFDRILPRLRAKLQGNF